jgi:hypothetical protein
MSDKFTPGLWRFCVGSGATEIRGAAVGDIPNPRVCRVLRSDPNNEANAQLIAAAPDLLAALQASQHAIGELRTQGAPTALWNDIEAANIAAIKKATGKEK